MSDSIKLVIRLLGWLVLSWCVMVTTHELGHIVGGWLSGATLIDYTLAPWRLPYSIHQPDPQPILTLAAGPIFGVLGPVGFAASIPRRYRVRRWAWFVADFCLLANGVYLALAWITGDHLLDTPRMLIAGVPPSAIVTFCAITILVGYQRFHADCVSMLLAAPGSARK